MTCGVATSIYLHGPTARVQPRRSEALFVVPLLGRRLWRVPGGRHRSLKGLLRVAVVLACLSICATSASATSPPLDPPVVGMVKSGSHWVLGPLNPRTLEPLRNRWSRRVSATVSLIRSPLGNGVVAVGPNGAVFLDSRTGHALRPVVAGDYQYASFYWFGGERFGAHGAANLLATVMDCGSGGCWLNYFDATTENVASAENTEAYLQDPPWYVFPAGLVVAADDGALALVTSVAYTGFIGWQVLLDDSRPYQANASDVAHDRLFMLTNNGAVAEIDHVGGQPQIHYHQVTLSGQTFQATWAGQGRIALLGADGLGTIDTLSWTAQSLDAQAQMVLPTPYGIVVVEDASVGGISVYRPGGGRRFTALAGMTIGDPSDRGPDPLVALGRYLYVVADGHRYTVDLASGHVLGRARYNVRLALPSYVPMP